MRTRKQEHTDSTAIAVVRVRGRLSTRSKIEHTLLLMNLSRKHHCALIPDDAIGRGMVANAKDFITWGCPSESKIDYLLEKAGRTADGKKLTDEYVKSNAGFASIKELAAQLFSGKIRLSRIKAIKPIFRLNPPRGGFKAIKLAYPKGALGKRSQEAIDALLTSMI